MAASKLMRYYWVHRGDHRPSKTRVAVERYKVLSRRPAGRGRGLALAASAALGFRGDIVFARCDPAAMTPTAVDRRLCERRIGIGTDMIESAFRRNG
jgi:hypothetical protein